MGVAAFNILIVDSRVIVRSGLKQILFASGIAKRVDETSAIADTEFLLRKRAYDVVLIRLGSEHEAEILMHSVSAPNALAGAKILLLGRSSDERRAVALLQAGAAGYLSENSVPDQVLAAVRAVAWRPQVLKRGARRAANPRALFRQCTTRADQSAFLARIRGTHFA